jgi:RHS repeat-associated protein
MLRDEDERDEKITSENEGRGNSYDFGARILDPRVGRFLSLDPMMNSFPWQSPNVFAGNDPINYIDLNGENAFFVHGTLQSSKEIKNSKSIRQSVDFLNSKLSTSTGDVDYGFDWSKLSGMFNKETHRKIAAQNLADYVIKNNKEGDDITLIGYSHGANVAIQAADIIYKRTGKKVNIISIAAPANNKEKKYTTFKNSTSSFARELYNLNQIHTLENPIYSKGLNDMIHFWLDDDGVSGGAAGDDFYKTSKVRNVHIDDGGMDWGKIGEWYDQSWKNAHGFIYFPKLIKENVENQNVVPLKSTK